MLIDTLRANSIRNSKSGTPDPMNEVVKALYPKLRSILISKARASSMKGEWWITTKVDLMWDLDLPNIMPEAHIDNEITKGIAYFLVREILEDLEFYSMISDIRLNETLCTITVTLDWRQ
ncbi:hypothetical protein vBPMCPL1_0027 [Proteus phage vB_PMC-PL1]